MGVGGQCRFPAVLIRARGPGTHCIMNNICYVSQYPVIRVLSILCSARHICLAEANECCGQDLAMVLVIAERDHLL